MKNREKWTGNNFFREFVPFSYCPGNERKSKNILVSFQYNKLKIMAFLVFSFLYLESNTPPIFHLGNHYSTSLYITNSLVCLLIFSSVVLIIVTDSVFTVLANVSNRNKKKHLLMGTTSFINCLHVNSAIFRRKSVETCIL